MFSFKRKCVIAFLNGASETERTITYTGKCNVCEVTRYQHFCNVIEPYLTALSEYPKLIVIKGITYFSKTSVLSSEVKENIKIKSQHETMLSTF